MAYLQNFCHCEHTLMEVDSLVKPGNGFHSIKWKKIFKYNKIYLPSTAVKYPPTLFKTSKVMKTS